MNVVDGEVDIPWISGRDKIIRASLQLLLREPQTVSQIGIYTPEYPNGVSVKDMTLIFSDNSTQQVSLKGLTEWEYIDIVPVTTDSVEFIVDDIYPTSTNNYLTIYEIQLFGQ